MKGKRGRKAGGSVPMKVSGNPNVIKEAEEKKRGGKVGKHVGKIHGGHPAHRMDRPGRKSGGRVGADKSPLSSAHKTSSATTRPASRTDASWRS
jgi:hypothetical protein